jgi:hypothetical protein
MVERTADNSERLMAGLRVANWDSYLESQWAVKTDKLMAADSVYWWVLMMAVLMAA